MATAGRSFVINLLANSDPAEKAFKKVGEAAGSIAKPIALVTAGIAAGFTLIVAGAAKAGKALFDLGAEFDDAFDKIRIGTGASGAAFEALQQSFRDVAVAVPQSFGETAGALADLNTRTNLTGERLETLTERTLTLARLLDQDVSGIISSTTRVFNRYNLSFAEQLDFLDLLLRANQATGASVDGIATQLLEAKPALDRMGFSLEEQVALLASFEREGVPAEKLVGAITRGVANFAKEGKPAADALKAVFDEIRKAPSGDEADMIGQRIFGARGFAAVVDAVRDGAFEIDAILGAISEGDTIVGLAEETDDLQEAWARFKNYLKLQFEPVATAVFTEATTLVEGLKPAVERVKEAFERDGLEGALEQVSIEWNAIYESRIKPLWDKFVLFLNETVLPLVIEAGVTIGTGIAEGIWNAFVKTVRSKFWSDEIANSIGGVDVLGQMRSTLGLPSLPKTPQPTFSVPNPKPKPLPQILPSDFGGRIAFMAEGGIVSSPTLSIIGEKGPEAVVPLDRLGGGGMTVNVTVTSADPQAVVDAIRRYTRQNGPLGQVVAV